MRHRNLLYALGDLCVDISRDLHRPQRKWIRDMILGIYRSESLMLSEIGRKLDEDTRLIHTEKRFSRNLNSDRLDDKDLLRRHLELASRATMKDNGEGVVTAVDYTDLAKPSADLHTGMELVCRCRVGSKGTIGTYPLGETMVVGPLAA